MTLAEHPARTRVIVARFGVVRLKVRGLSTADAILERRTLQAVQPNHATAEAGLSHAISVLGPMSVLRASVQWAARLA